MTEEQAGADPKQNELEHAEQTGKMPNAPTTASPQASSVGTAARGASAQMATEAGTAMGSRAVGQAKDAGRVAKAIERTRIRQVGQAASKQKTIKDVAAKVKSAAEKAAATAGHAGGMEQLKGHFIEILDIHIYNAKNKFTGKRLVPRVKGNAEAYDASRLIKRKLPGGVQQKASASHVERTLKAMGKKNPGSAKKGILRVPKDQVAVAHRRTGKRVKEVKGTEFTRQEAPNRLERGVNDVATKGTRAASRTVAVGKAGATGALMSSVLGGLIDIPALRRGDIDKRAYAESRALDGTERATSAAVGTLASGLGAAGATAALGTATEASFAASVGAAGTAAVTTIGGIGTAGAAVAGTLGGITAMSSHSSVSVVGAPPASARRRAVGFLLVAPLFVLLALRVNHFVHDPLLTSYGAIVLGMSAIVIYLAFRHYRDPSLDPGLAPATPFVSCLVAVKNEEEVITKCVDSLFASAYPRFDVIVIDDGSTDATPQLLRDLEERHAELRVLTLPESIGKKRALTAGVQHAAGEIFVFSDSDCVVEPDAIGRIVGAFCAHPDLGAVSGHARALNASRNILTKTQDTWYEGQFSVWKAAESVFGVVTCISGPLAGFRREAVFNFLPAWANDRFLGKDFPFATDRQLTAYVLGAAYVGEQLKRRYADSPFVRDADYPCRRWRTGYVKSARVRTVVPWTLRRLVRQQVRWKKSFIRNLFFVGSFQWRRGPLPALLFYGRALFIVAAPLMAFRHLVWIPMHGGYVLTALYLLGIAFKGSIWAFAYRSENPGCSRWIYRPLMSLMTVLLFSMLLPYSLLTIRRGAWSRG